MTFLSCFSVFSTHVPRSHFSPSLRNERKPLFLVGISLSHLQRYPPLPASPYLRPGAAAAVAMVTPRALALHFIPLPGSTVPRSLQHLFHLLEAVASLGCFPSSLRRLGCQFAVEKPSGKCAKTWQLRKMQKKQKREVAALVTSSFLLSSCHYAIGQHSAAPHSPQEQV